MSELHRGVQVSAEQLGSNEGAYGDVILVIEAPDDELAEFEVDEPYREFAVPAAVLNRWPIVKQIPDWVPEDDPHRRELGLEERRPGWRAGDPLWPE
jgi:hypothetical protein